MLGRATHQAIEDARNEISELLGCWPDEVVFTAGGSESNNLAIKGSIQRAGNVADQHLIISSIEHPATTKPAEFLKRLGCEVSVCPCDSRGVIDPADVAREMQSNTTLVSIMHANNEVGTIQPIREIGQMCQERGVLFHTDAAQSVGKIATHVNELNVDMLTIAGHKLYAPKGVGALFVRRGTELEPLIHGAGHEQGLRAGTENVPYMVGLGTAARLVNRSLSETSSRLSELRDQLKSQLQIGIGSELRINSGDAEVLPNTLSVNFPKVRGYELLARIPELCASTGSACHSGESTISPTLSAMGLDASQAAGTVRLSVGWQTSRDEVEKTANLLIEAWETLSA